MQISEHIADVPARVEARIWAMHFEQHRNILLRECAAYLNEVYRLGLPIAAAREPLTTHHFSGQQREEAREWFGYFQHHSHVALQELAYLLPLWYLWLETEA